MLNEFNQGRMLLNATDYEKVYPSFPLIADHFIYYLLVKYCLLYIVSPANCGLRANLVRNLPKT